MDKQRRSHFNTARCTIDSSWLFIFGRVSHAWRIKALSVSPSVQPSFVAVCKNIKHYSVAKPHSGLPSPLSFFHKQLFVFVRYSSPSLSFSSFFLCLSLISQWCRKKVIKEICVRQELLIISERAKLWTSAILSDLNCWHLFYYSITV